MNRSSSDAMQTHWLLGSGYAFQHAPHRFPAELANQNGGLGRFRILHKEFIAISDPSLVHHVLVSKRHRYVKSYHLRNIAIIVGTGLFGSEGEHWQKNRRRVQPSFQPLAMKRFVPMVVETLARLIVDEWDPATMVGTPFLAGREMHRVTLAVMSRTLFSTHLPVDVMDSFGQTLQASLQAMRNRNHALVQSPLWLPIAKNRELLACRDRVDTFVKAEVAKRLADERPELQDILSDLVAVRDPDAGTGMSQAEIVDQAKSLLLAGYETTGVALSWALYLIAQHPEVASRLRDEVDATLAGRSPTWEDLPKLVYTGQVVQETLRLYPPVYSIVRQCNEDDEINGHKIRKGCLVIISIYGMHHSPAWGDDVHVFRPGRFSGTEWPKKYFMPFSSGPHVCLGNNFTLLEMVIAIAMIMQRYTLVCLEGEPVEAKGVVTLVPDREIRMKVARR